MTGSATYAPPQASQNPPPGWYQNPEGPGQRYWDGIRWTDQYAQAPVPPAPQVPSQPTRGSGHKAARIVLVVLLVAVGVVGLAGVALLGGEKGTDGGGGKAAAAKKADRAYDRLDGTIVRNSRRTNDAVDLAFSKLAKASNRSPYGGPILAAVVPTIERSTATVRRQTRQLDATYRASPSYLQRIYKGAYRETRHSLVAATDYLGALAQWARVHGASSYRGQTEFGVIERQRTRLSSEYRQQNRALKKAQSAWYRYANKRWGLRYD